MLARAGAPLQFSYENNPVLPGYARFPAIDFVSTFDFKACPSIVKSAKYQLVINPGPFCWVTGTLRVRPRRYCCKVKLQMSIILDPYCQVLHLLPMPARAS